MDLKTPVFRIIGSINTRLWYSKAYMRRGRLECALKWRDCILRKWLAKRAWPMVRSNFGALVLGTTTTDSSDSCCI